MDGLRDLANKSATKTKPIPTPEPMRPTLASPAPINLERPGALKSSTLQVQSLLGGTEAKERKARR